MNETPTKPRNANIPTEIVNAILGYFNSNLAPETLAVIDELLTQEPRLLRGNMIVIMGHMQSQILELTTRIDHLEGMLCAKARKPGDYI